MTHNLFEYQNKLPWDDSLNGLESFLDEIWQRRDTASSFWKQDDEQAENQRFLQFIHKSKELKSNKYVGVIHFEGQKINLLPKIFFNEDRTYTSDEVQAMHLHLLWWLSYCRKIKFPKYQSAMGSLNSDFFEVLIYLFSKYTRELLSSSIYQNYEEIDREISFMKGRIDTPAYIRQNLSRARWHKICCSFDAFVMDNAFNRIIKYVSTMLFNYSTNLENKKNLREILFILDEVSDEPATAKQCSSIQFNPMFGNFEIVRDYCQLFLSNSISYHYKLDFKLFAFLLPMEYVFEDFIFGFINKELPQLSPKAQRSDVFLDADKRFNLKPDLWLKSPERSLIADTKYKIVYSDSIKGFQREGSVAQSDLYQMLAYAIRFAVDYIVLFYPNSIKQPYLDEMLPIRIEDALIPGRKVKIRIHKLPILNLELLKGGIYASQRLDELFEGTKWHLKRSLNSVLNAD